MSTEKKLQPASGWSQLPICLGLIACAPIGLVIGIMLADNVSGWLGGPLIIAGILAGFSGLVMSAGFQAVAPNDHSVGLLLGQSVLQ